MSLNLHQFCELFLADYNNGYSDLYIDTEYQIYYGPAVCHCTLTNFYSYINCVF